MFNLPVPERAAHGAISLPTCQDVHEGVQAKGPGQETQAADSAHSGPPTPPAAETGHSRICAFFLETQNSSELYLHHHCSADWQSAVSPIANRQYVRKSWRGVRPRFAPAGGYGLRQPAPPKLGDGGSSGAFPIPSFLPHRCCRLHRCAVICAVIALSCIGFALSCT